MNDPPGLWRSACRLLTFGNVGEPGEHAGQRAAAYRAYRRSLFGRPGLGFVAPTEVRRTRRLGDRCITLSSDLLAGGGGSGDDTGAQRDVYAGQIVLWR